MDLSKLQAAIGHQQGQQQHKHRPRYPDGGLTRENYPQWLADHGVEQTGRTNESGGKLIVPIKCPFGEHSGGASKTALLFHNDGGVGFDCKSDSCKDKTIRDFYEKVAPEELESRNPGRVNTAEEAENLMQELHFVFDRGELWLYNNGAYRRNAEIRIKQALQQRWGAKYKENLAQEVVRYISTAKYSFAPMLDLRRDIINCKNGVIEIGPDGARTFRPHSPNDFSSVQLSVIYDPQAACPRIAQFFSEILPSDSLSLVIEFVGYLLLPLSKYEKALLLVGTVGGNGKSTFINLVESLLGPENTSSETLQDINGNRFRAANLAGQLANLAADISNASIDAAATFKALVSGDKVTAERKGQQPFEFRNFARLIFSCNEIPKSRDVTPAYFRRWLVVPFVNKFVEGVNRDPNLIDKLTTPAELSGLLNLALDGLERLTQRGYFEENAATKEALAAYRKSCDTVEQFVDERIEVAQRKCMASSDVYAAYVAWVAENGYRPLSQGRLTARLCELTGAVAGRYSIGNRQQRGFRGIALQGL